jgi:hypothetical protein
MTMSKLRHKPRSADPDRLGMHGDAEEERRNRRRAEMQSSEGHSGSIPRSNPELERDKIQQREHESDRVTGH